MRRCSILLAITLMALPALAAAQTAKPEASKPAATAKEKARKAVPAAKSAPAKAATPSKASAAAAQKANFNPAERAEMLRRRGTFRYAASSCASGGDRCDKELLDDAEQAFINACRACDTVDRCEGERAAILAGNTNATSLLCAP